jgi:hypothetical protein
MDGTHLYQPIDREDYAALGVSVGGCLIDGVVRWFDILELDAFMQDMLNAGHQLVTFNGRKFDVPLMCASAINRRVAEEFAQRYMMPCNHCDLLDLICRVDSQNSGDSLDSLRQLCARRTVEHTIAPHLWRQGCTAALFNYCQRDLLLTHGFYKLICDTQAFYPDELPLLHLPLPFSGEYEALYTTKQRSAV